MPRHKHARMNIEEFKNWYLHWYWIPFYWRMIREMRLFQAEKFFSVYNPMNERTD